MIKWDVIEGAEKYNITIDGYDTITTVQPYINISHISRDKERKGYIVAVSNLCKSEKSFFVLEKILETPKVDIIVDNNRVLSTLIKLKGSHRIIYGPTPQSLDKEKEFNNEIRILSNEYPRFYFRLNNKIYYNLSFLPKSCNKVSKTNYRLQVDENRMCQKEYTFSSDPKAVGYVLYIPKTFISKPIDSIFVVGSAVNVCKYDYNEGYVYPYYLDDQGKLCDYGEGIRVDLTPF